MDTFLSLLSSYPLWTRMALFAGVAGGAHLLVLLVRHAARHILAVQRRPAYRKLSSVASLVSSTLIFLLYFLALGFILRELGVNIKAYLASASVIGLAVGFGAQGVVQDVVTGLTFIFSDLIDVGELVEVSGQTGIVRSIGMRFVELENALGARVFLPNRTINNVINYPKGYVRLIADITLSADSNKAQEMQLCIEKQVASIYEQFPAILLTEPSIEGRRKTSSGKEFLRVKFRIWPNRGDPIEKTFKSETLARLKQWELDYQDWMIAVFYEVEERKPAPVRRVSWGRRPKTGS